MENKIPIRFFVITFLWSWLCFGVIIVCCKLGIISGQNSVIGFLMTVIGAFGPAVGAFISLYTIEGKGSIKRYLKSFLSLNFGLNTWLAIFFILGIASFIAWIIPELFGEERLHPFSTNLLLFFPALLFMTFFGGGQEELGWRGYIMPYLEKRFGLLVGSIILGIVWAVWHIPMWFVPESGQINVPFLGFLIMTIGYSFIYSWIIEASGKRLLSGLIVHGTGNVFSGVFPNIIPGNGCLQPRHWIYCSLVLIIGLIIVVIRTNKLRKTAHNRTVTASQRPITCPECQLQPER
jgi:membrane protease YdiL (CAAX protease family)